MKRVVAGLLVCLGTAAGLAAEDKLTETPFYPLPVGTTWHYKAGEGQFTIRVAKHEKVGDTLCARLEVTRDGKVIGVQHLAVTADGVYCHDLTYRAPKGDSATGKDGEHDVTQTPKPPILMLKLPPKKGDSWKVDSKGDGKSFRGAFQIDEKEVKMQDRTYKTVCVTSQDLEVNGLKPTITTYYANGTGMVKQVIQEGNVTTTIELEKFEAGK
jgi:hypothetical protein